MRFINIIEYITNGILLFYLIINSYYIYNKLNIYKYNINLIYSLIFIIDITNIIYYIFIICIFMPYYVTYYRNIYYPIIYSDRIKGG